MSTFSSQAQKGSPSTLKVTSAAPNDQAAAVSAPKAGVAKPRENAIAAKVATAAVNPEFSEDQARHFLASLPVSNTAIGLITSPEAIAMGERPAPYTIFNLCFMRAVQKVAGGYMMQSTPPGELGSGDVIFVQTDLQLPEETTILSNGYWAVYVGPFRYEAMNGFEREIYGFVLLTPKPTSQPRDLSSVDEGVIYALMAKRKAEGN